jgi:hypothetical protein
MNKIIIVRRLGNFGIDKYLNGYNLETQKSITKRCWNNRLCWKFNNTVISKNQINKLSLKCNFELKQDCPF